MGRTAPVSVVIPTLNEESRLAACVRSLLRSLPACEVLVVDGGSEDRTREVAASFHSAGVATMSGPRGRGPQMNAGAAAATGDTLLFLHADVTLPDDAARWIDEAFSDPRVVAGAFRTRTVTDGESSPLRPLLRLADLRSRFTGLPYGDQALFVRASAFRRVGGFAAIPIMEDLDFARRLRREGEIRTVPAFVTVSGRRFLRRPVASAVSMNLFPLLYRLGVSPWLLARLYGDPR